MIRILAYLNLLSHLVQNLLERWVLRRRRGLTDFLHSYREDRIIPFTSEEKKLLTLFSRCIQCGLCDSLCPVSGVTPGPSFLPMLARSVPNFAPLPLPLERCAGCPGCESICPTGVPLRQLVDFIRRKMEVADHG